MQVILLNPPDTDLRVGSVAEGFGVLPARRARCKAVTGSLG